MILDVRLLNHKDNILFTEILNEDAYSLVHEIFCWIIKTKDTKENVNYTSF